MTKLNKMPSHIRIILFIVIIISLFFGVGVIAGSLKPLNNIKIVFANNHEMNVVTSKNKVEDILKENHIELLEGEIVVPGLNSEIDDNTTILITKESEVNSIAVLASKGENITLEELEKTYAPIVEKIIVEQIEIPFETVTKNTANSSSATTEKIVQQGKNGLKEITYRVKYQNDVEIERIEISAKIVSEPVNKIVEIANKQVTSRYSDTPRAVSGSKAEYQAYAKQKCAEYGWSDNDFQCLVNLWTRESGWCVTSKNSSSGAYGIPQALPASKMASAGSDYLTNYKTQINWGLSYIKSRYVSPANAWNHFLSRGWY